MISACAPDYVGTLTLHLDEGIKKEFHDKFAEPFAMINDGEALDELYDIVSRIEIPGGSQTVFRANHGSNAYMIKGAFPQDKREMLSQIDWLRRHPEVARPQGLRGF